MKLIIKGTLPSTNEILAASNSNRHVYNSMKQKFTFLVSMYAIKEKLPQLPVCDYIFTWYCPDTRKDKDNISGGAKFVFDGLVKAGVLKNDNWKNIGDISHRFRVDRINPRIEIEIIIPEAEGIA